MALGDQSQETVSGESLTGGGISEGLEVVQDIAW